MKRTLAGIILALLVAGCGSVQRAPGEQPRLHPMGLVSPGDTIRVSVANESGEEVIGLSQDPSISADGRVVAFQSSAHFLVHDDTDSTGDVFVHDHDTGTTTRVSVDNEGNEANDYSLYPTISADGRIVAFASHATNLVEGDTNGQLDVFVHNLDDGTTTRVSVHDDGSEGTSFSMRPDISGDGRYVAFQSNANNLVDGDTNEAWDVFVHDRVNSTTTLVSEAVTGASGTGHSDRPSISYDGTYVAFESGATDLVSGDTNNVEDVFVRNRATSVTTRISVQEDGTQVGGISTEPSISNDGRFVAFQSTANNLVADDNPYQDVFVHDRQDGTVTRVSVGSGGEAGDRGAHHPSISGDGRYVAFETASTNFASPDENNNADVFVHDRATGTTTLISEAVTGGSGNEFSGEPSISDDGTHVAFESSASDLVSDDRNDAEDVFVHRLVPASVYSFDGFHEPLENLPASNRVNAGRSIPIKFSLAGDHGLDILDGTPTTHGISCDDATAPTGDATDAATAGKSGLRYDAVSDEYTYVMRTSRSWRGTCRAFTLTLDDGTQHTAHFEFR